MPENYDLGTAVLIALCFVLLFASVLGFVYFHSSEREHSTKIYIVPNSYTNYLDGNETSFTLAMENGEGKDMNYAARFFAGNRIIGSRQFFLQSGEKYRERIVLDLEGRQEQFPFKIRSVVSADGKGIQVFYWVLGQG